MDRPLNGAIFGIVSEEGTVKPSTPVILVDRTTNTVIARTTTDQYGGYAFRGLDPDSNAYAVYTQDNDGVTPKNALIKDYITPVTTTEGNMAGNFPAALMRMLPVMSMIPTASGMAHNVAGLKQENFVPQGFQPDFGTSCVADASVGAPIPSMSKPVALRMTNAIPVFDHDVFYPGYGHAEFTTWNDLFLATGRNAVTPRGRDFASLLLVAAVYVDYANPVSVFHTAKANAAPGGPNMDGTGWEDGQHYYWNYQPHANRDTSWWNNHHKIGFTVNATGQLRARWVENTGPTLKDVLVASGLTDKKWYLILMRWDKTLNGSRPQFTVVPAGGVRADYDCPTAIVQPFYNEYSGTRANMRAGISVEGAPGWTGTVLSGNSTTGFEYKTDGTGALAPCNGRIGMVAYGFAYPADADVSLLAESYNTTTKRLLPRYLSEVHADIPALYLPMDDLDCPRDRKLSVNTQRVGGKVTGLGKLAHLTGKFSGRRRTPQWHPGGTTFHAVSADAYRSVSYEMVVHWTAFDYKLCEHPLSLLATAPANVRTLFALRSPYQGGAGQSYDVWKRLAVTPTGALQLTSYLQDSSRPVLTFGNSPMSVGTHHLVVTVDKHDDFRTRLYIDGALVDSQITGSVNHGTARTMGRNQHFNSELWIGGEPMDGYYGNAMHTRTGNLAQCPITDFAFYQHKLSDADVARHYAAFLIATGDNAQA